MNEYDVKRLALVLSVQAEIEAMKAANIGVKFAVYGYADFVKLSLKLQDLAYAHNEQLNTL